MTMDRQTILDGAFRIAREPATDALFQVLQAYPRQIDPLPLPELRKRSHAVIVGIQGALASNVPLSGILTLLGTNLAASTDGSDDAFVAIASHLRASMESQIPSQAGGDMHEAIMAVLVRVMHGWLNHHHQDPASRGELAQLIRQRMQDAADVGVHARVLEQAPYGVHVFDHSSMMTVVYNTAYEQMFGYTVDEDMELDADDWRTEDSADDDFDMFSSMIAGDIPFVDRISARRHKDGRSLRFRMLGWPIRDADGHVTHLAHQYTLLDREVPGVAGSGLAEKRSRYLHQISPDPMVIADASGIIRYASPSVESTIGHDPDQIVGKHVQDFIVPTSSSIGQHMFEELFRTARAKVVVELEVFLADGTTRWFEVLGRNLLDVEDVQGVVLQGRDVTERMVLQQELEKAIRSDGLTGLLNRRGFDERLHAELGSPVRDAGDRVAVLCYADLDHFKQINDTHGHAAGDAVLVAVGDRLRELVEGIGFAGRMGGDEFTLCVRLDDRDQVAVFCQRIEGVLSGAIDHEGADIAFAGSYGATVVPIGLDAVDTERIRHLLIAADRALGKAKAARTEGIVVG